MKIIAARAAAQFRHNEFAHLLLLFLIFRSIASALFRVLDYSSQTKLEPNAIEIILASCGIRLDVNAAIVKCTGGPHVSTRCLD